MAGTALSGVWQAVKAVPRYAAAGNWQLSSVIVHDLAGNLGFLNSTQLQAAGINPILAVSSSPSDTSLPALNGLSFSPPLFNTSAGPQTVTITMNASDNLSGVDLGPTTASLSYPLLGLISPSNGQSQNIYPFNVPTRVGGTPLSGTWQTSLTWPQFSEEGTWKDIVHLL